jgi:hypothetical protein
MTVALRIPKLRTHGGRRRVSPRTPPVGESGRTLTSVIQEAYIQVS